MNPTHRRLCGRPGGGLGSALAAFLVFFSVFSVFSVFLVAFPRAARAEDEVDPRSIEAENLAEEARALLDAGEHQSAVDLYVRAQELAPSAILLFDIAFVHDHFLRSPLLATEYYRRCIAALDVTPALRERARARTEELEHQAAVPLPVAVTPSDAPPASSSSWHPIQVGGVIVAGAGVAALGTTAVLALLAKNKDDEAASLCNGDSCASSRALGLTDDAVGLASAANVVFAAGAVLLVTGVTLFLLSPKPARSVRVTARGLGW